METHQKKSLDKTTTDDFGRVSSVTNSGYNLSYACKNSLSRQR